MEANSAAVIELAQQLGCSPADVLCLARGAANDMKKDGVADFFLANPDSRVELAQAYVQPQVRKFDQFHTIYHGNSEATNVFRMRVYHLLKEAA